MNVSDWIKLGEFGVLAFLFYYVLSVVSKKLDGVRSAIDTLPQRIADTISRVMRKSAAPALFLSLAFLAGCTAQDRRDFTSGFEREILRQAIDAAGDRINEKLGVKLDSFKEKLDDAADDSGTGVWAGLGALAAMLTAGGTKAAAGALRSKVGKRDET